MSITPFVVGQWVRAEKFYGRATLIEDIVHGPRNWLWLLGTRRIGKTSLLKQVEHLTAADPKLGYLPIFWDFQGADDPKELHATFNEALFDAEERLEGIGVALDDVEGDDLFRSLTRLRRKVSASGLRLLLLCDEVEELIKLAQQQPSLLRRLRRVMQSQEDIRSVLASTIRLWALADVREDTSPFLHGFTPPLYIHNLSDSEALDLIHQANLPDESRPKIDAEAAEKIRAHCDNHPYLIQLVCKRFVEQGRLDEAIEQVASDPMVSYFFSVDFEMLSETERGILRVIAEHASSTSNSIQNSLAVEDDTLAGVLHRLEHLGYVRRNVERRYVLVNYFFNRWFRTQPGVAVVSAPTVAPAPPRSSTALPTMEGSTEPGAGRVLDNRYELQDCVGRGATGEVYRAYDQLLRVTLAVKLLKQEYSSNPEALERLRQEIVLAREISHANVVKIFHLGETDGRMYLTMQWTDGPSLAKVIERDAPLPLSRILAVGVPLASALEALHRAGVLHRDIKPHNILLDRSGAPYLVDFGLARLMGQPGITRSGIFLGTPDYASPEQAELGDLDERSDVYSLGVVLFEMATGRRPFRGKTAREVLELHRSTPPPRPEELNPAVSGPLSRVILRCLEKHPERRYANATALHAALRAL